MCIKIMMFAVLLLGSQSSMVFASTSASNGLAISKRPEPDGAFLKKRKITVDYETVDKRQSSSSGFPSVVHSESVEKSGVDRTLSKAADLKELPVPKISFELRKAKSKSMMPIRKHR